MMERPVDKLVRQIGKTYYGGTAMSPSHAPGRGTGGEASSERPTEKKAGTPPADAPRDPARVAAAGGGS
jgi:hypothetical protein